MKIFLIGGVTVPETDPDYERQIGLLTASAQRLGEDIAERGHDLVVCSPRANTVDACAVQGAVKAMKAGRGKPVIEFHYPLQDRIQAEIDQLAKELSFEPNLNPYRVPLTRSGELEGNQPWMLPQVSALDRSQLTIGLGGRIGGAASLLFGIAQGRRNPVLPLTFLGGAAEFAFQARQYELEDRLGQTAALHNPNQIGKIIEVAEALAKAQLAKAIRNPELRFFISYPKARPQEADFIEMMLRRRNYTVFRDEHDFGAGQVIQNEITEHMHRANVFIAVWCREYALSPWCFDEFSHALEKHDADPDALALWILLADDTRMIPKPARNKIGLPASTRAELERSLRDLLERVAGSRRAGGESGKPI